MHLLPIPGTPNHPGVLRFLQTSLPPGFRSVEREVLSSSATSSALAECSKRIKEMHVQPTDELVGWFREGLGALEGNGGRWLIRKKLKTLF